MNINTVNITFRVSDFQQAVSFYENVLGLQKKSQWPTCVVFDLCGMMLGLEPGGERGVMKVVQDIYLQVDNVDETYRELKGKGVEFLTEPKDQSWGARTAKFTDPDGNKVTIESFQCKVCGKICQSYREFLEEHLRKHRG